jgi:hypothetical protein
MCHRSGTFMQRSNSYVDLHWVKQLVADVITPYFTGSADAVRGELLCSPQQIADHLLAGASEAQPVTAPAAPPPAPAAPGVFRRMLQRVPLRWRPKRPQVPCACEPIAPGRIVCRFPRFNLRMPAMGLFVGGKWKSLWVSPLVVELSHNREVPGQWQELHWRFRLTYSDGTMGEAGFIDRRQPGGDWRRLHRFPDGSLASNDNYPHSRLNHDVFRSLLAVALLIESTPASAGPIQDALPTERRPEASPPTPRHSTVIPMPQPLRLAPKAARTPASIQNLPAARTAG